MTKKSSLELIQEEHDRVRKRMKEDPAYAREFLKSLGLLKKRRTIVGEERERVLTMLRLMGPGEQSNNQHVWTESWRVGNIEYNYHVGVEFDDLEEVIDDE